MTDDWSVTRASWDRLCRAVVAFRLACILERAFKLAKRHGMTDTVTATALAILSIPEPEKPKP